jgi:hypothetical protein
MYRVCVRALLCVPPLLALLLLLLLGGKKKPKIGASATS